MPEAPRNLRILGVDPGLNITGYGVLDVTAGGLAICEAGVVRGGSSRHAIELRLKTLFNGITEIIEAFQPSVLALEQLYSHYARPQTAILMGHARGVICLAAALREIPVRHYAATQVKKVLTGSGRARKTRSRPRSAASSGWPRLQSHPTSPTPWRSPSATPT